LAIVAHALLKIAKRGLKTNFLRGMALVALALILFLNVPFPVIVIGAGLTGALLALGAPALVGVGNAPAEIARVSPEARRGAFVAAAWCLLAWWAPVALAAALLGPGHVLVDVGVFFSKLAVITFGGAYALLAYLAQAAVDMGWVSTREMIDGLGLAETTPGPTILVNQFVAFLAGMRDAGPLAPLVAASLAAIMATWVTFAPSFLWIFAGAPFVEVLRRDPRLAGALAGITAAVVGVIAFLAIWFALHVLFREVGEVHVGPVRLLSVAFGSLDPRAAVLSAIAFVVMFVFHRGVMTTVGVLALLGVAAKALFP
jgi:chromate transporter